jgi:hypothetical protein
LNEDERCSEERRAMQMDKAFRCATLFKSQYWSEIVEILRVLDEKKKATEDRMKWETFEEEAGKSFKQICTKAGLGKALGYRGKEIDDREWLWNYLRNFDSRFTDTPCW